jgi:hypothetical protein
MMPTAAFARPAPPVRTRPQTMGRWAMTVSHQGNLLVPLVMFGWVPVVLLLFSRMKPKTAAAAAFAAGWLFLPVVAYRFQGLPDYTKMTATCAGILLAAWIYDRKSLLGFRFKTVDLPMLLWCTCPFLSSVANGIQGLGVYDGLSETMYQTITWGLPYFIARVYFSDREGLAVLAKTVFIGGLVYIPFCLFELKMSPQLHRLTYGYHQHNFLQTLRGDGFRPMVYMEHGLMTAMWMVSASFIGLWLARARALPERILSIPHLALIIPLLAVTLMMKSAGAFALLLIGLTVLYLSNKTKSALLVWVLLLVPPSYIVLRTGGIWNGENLSRLVAEKFSAERGQSLQFRFDNETILIDKAREGTLFGWGGWNRSRVYDDDGRDVSITDGLWIITLGTRGMYGLTLLLLTVQLPMLLLLYRAPPARWHTPAYAPAAVLAVILSLYMVDNLLNAMVNPIFMLFNGGLCGMLSRRRQPGADRSEAVATPMGLPVAPLTRFITAGPAIGPRYIGEGRVGPEIA